MKLCHARDRTELIHAVKTIEDSPIVMTHCGWQVRKVLPHVAIDCWGNDDMQWCPGCTPAVRRNGRASQPGAAYSYNRLTDEGRAEIVRLKIEGVSTVRIAEKVGTSAATVCTVWRQHQEKAGDTNAIQV